MNIFLQFKKESHAEAYEHDLELQVAKRFWMILVFTIAVVGFIIINWILTKSLTLQPYDIGKTVATFVLLAGIIILKYNFRRCKRYISKINFFLDICMIYCVFVPFPYMYREALMVLTKVGVWVMAWTFSIMAISATFAISNWWLRTLGPIFQVVFFMIPMIQEEILWRVILVFIFAYLFIYVCYTYIGERYQRKDFLEKRRVYENYEALLTIFDDIIQGIMIADPKYNLIYSNRTIDFMFGQQQVNRSLEYLFSQIQVKSTTPQLDTMSTERIQTTYDESVTYNTVLSFLIQVYDRNLKIL